MTRAFYVTTPIYYISGEPAHRPRLHDGRRRRARAHGAHRRPGVLSDRHRRARAKGRERRRSGREDAASNGATSSFRAGRRSSRPITSPTTISSARPSHATSETCSASSSGCAKAATSISESTRAGIASTTRRSGSNRSSSTAAARRADAKCSGSPRTIGSSGSRRIATACSEYFRAHPQWVRPQERLQRDDGAPRGRASTISRFRARNFDWGIPIPGGGGVIYVWFDALLNYITAIGWSEDDARFRYVLAGLGAARRQGDRALSHDHLAGRSVGARRGGAANSSSHTAGSPSTGRRSARASATPSIRSRSRERFGADSMRYFLLREAPFGSDFSYSEEKIAQRHNSDLGNDLGNLLHRTLSMLQQYRDGIVPQRRRRRECLCASASHDLSERARSHRDPRPAISRRARKPYGSSSPR